MKLNLQQKMGSAEVREVIDKKLLKLQEYRQDAELL